MRATPPPVLRLPRKSCANRISLNVFQHREQMLIALDDERFVPTLVQMSAPDGFCLGVVATSVRRAEPLQCFADVAILLWIQKQVPVIRHENVRKDAHVKLLAHFIEKILEILIHPAFLKNREPPIGAIDDVVHLISNIDPWLASHEKYYTMPKPT